MLWFKKSDSPEGRLKNAAKVSRKTTGEIEADLRMLKREYGIDEETYYSKEFYRLSAKDMTEAADRIRLTDYRAGKIAAAAGLDKAEVMERFAEAEKNFGIDEKEYYEGKYWLYEDIEKRLKERNKEKKKNKLSADEIKTIMTAAGMSKKEAEEAVVYAKENFNIDPRVYFDNKYYLKAENVMARLNTARKKKEANQKRMFDHIKRDSGRTRADVRKHIKELNAKYEGIDLKLPGYYAYGFYALSEEETAKIADIILRKKAMAETIDLNDPEQVREYSELVKESLNRARKKHILSFISNALPELRLGDPRTEEIIVDMQTTRDLLGFQLGEYVTFKFWNKSFKERQEYVSNEFKNRTIKRMNTFKGRSISDNKYAAYCLLKPYYRREAVLLESKGGYEGFLDFCERHSTFIKKSNFDSLGVGLEKVTIDENSVLRNIYDDITENGKRILLEELIVPHPDMKRLNPSSVNTIRLYTFYDYKGVPSIQDCALRIGHKDSVVDNAGAGGILTHVDITNGKVDSLGIDKAGALFEVHPDHGYTFLGYQLPAWEKAEKMALELAGKIDGLRYIGWDLTCNSDGEWVVVECNGIPQFFGQQATVNEGRKKRLMSEIGPTLEYIEKEEAEQQE